MTLFGAYPWLKGLHVAAAILFVGGVLAETVFLAVHRQAAELGTEQRRAILAFRTWDSLLTTPAMLLVWAFGLTLALWAHWFHSGWLLAKLVLVCVLSGLHGIQSGTLRHLAGRPGRSRAQWLPVLTILICTPCIALLAVVKPF